jgi:hypothetical protein
MPTHGLELDLENFLLRTVPSLAEQWQGATPEEISQIERLVDRPLPAFYHWFLTHMGQSMGALAYPSLDFSARQVLACYAKKVVVPHARFLLIGYSSDEQMPLHVFYDLDVQSRTDARVTKRYARGGELHDQFETFREMLAWGALLNFRVNRMPQRCRALVTGEDPHILSHLAPVMEELGFNQPILTGACCGLYERSDTAMVCNKTPRDEPEAIMVLKLGGGDPVALRRVLGTIAARSSLRLKVREWDPPLL